MLELSYSVVEQALAQVYRAGDDEKRRSEFRARINSLQRLGVLGEDFKVGKGQKLTYRVEHIERWLCCLELAELGISPTIAGKLVIAHWTRLAAIFKAAQRTVINPPGADDVIGARLHFGQYILALLQPTCKPSSR